MAGSEMKRVIGSDNIKVDYVLGRVRRNQHNSFGERVSLGVNTVTSNIYFVFLLVCFYIVWITVNVLLKKMGKDFDHPWDFPILLFISNAIQLIIPFIILIAQRRQEEKINDIIDKILLLMEKNDEDTREIRDQLASGLGQAIAGLDQLSLHHQAISNRLSLLEQKSK